MNRIARAFGAFALVTVCAAPAAAYVQTTTCTLNGGPFACKPGETPQPVHWNKRCIVYYVNEKGTTDIPGPDGKINPDVLAAVQAAFKTWTDVPSSDFEYLYGGLTNEDRAEYASDRGSGGNANIVIWRDQDWPYASTAAFALTSVTFDPATGLIADSDMELNGANHPFTVGDTNIKVDVQNTVTHEAGHFLGLDHSSDPEATMYGSAPLGETKKRSLSPDDIAGVAHIYPAGAGDMVTCPSHPDFFQKPSGNSKSKGCCAVVSRRAAPRAGWLALIAALGLFFRRRR